MARRISQNGRACAVRTHLQARSLPARERLPLLDDRRRGGERGVGTLLRQSHPHPLNVVTSERGREGEFVVNRELRHVGRRRSGHPPRHIREREVQLPQLAEQSPDGGIELFLAAGQHWQ